jgi:hypothetical protein
MAQCLNFKAEFPEKGSKYWKTYFLNTKMASKHYVLVQYTYTREPSFIPLKISESLYVGI